MTLESSSNLALICESTVWCGVWTACSKDCDISPLPYTKLSPCICAKKIKPSVQNFFTIKIICCSGHVTCQIWLWLENLTVRGTRNGTNVCKQLSGGNLGFQSKMWLKTFLSNNVVVKVPPPPPPVLTCGWSFPSQCLLWRCSHYIAFRCGCPV